MDDLTPEQRHEAYGSSKPPIGTMLLEEYLEPDRPKYAEKPDATLILRKKGDGLILAVYAGNVTRRPDLTNSQATR